MKKVICENGHFYDADRFAYCPVCGHSLGESLPEPELTGGEDSEATAPLPQSSVVDELGPTEWLPPEEIDRLWEDTASDTPPEPAGQPESSDGIRTASDGNWQVDELAPTMWITPDFDAPTEKVDSPVPQEHKEVEGAPAWETDASLSEKTSEGADTSQAEETNEGTYVGQPEETGEDTYAGLPEEISEEPDAGRPVEAGDWQTDAQQRPALVPDAADVLDGSTIAPARRKEAAASPTVLPVGWLVALSGVYKGNVFLCRKGRNCIGRAAQMDISLPDEPSVDQIAHAQIIYEPKKRQFFLQTGSGNGLCYLNYELVFTHKELHSYDRVTLGDAEFLFVPLCGESFEW